MMRWEQGSMGRDCRGEWRRIQPLAPGWERGWRRKEAENPGF